MEETRCECGANVSCECGPKEEQYIDGLEMGQIPVKDLEYWRLNAEEDYITTPISVLRYISELEKVSDEKREGVEKMINQHRVLKHLTLVNPRHLQMTSNGHGEFPDGYKLTEKGIQYIIEQLNKEQDGK